MASSQSSARQCTSYLLQLPGELRNWIWEYALTEEQNLLLRRDKNTGRLYLVSATLVPFVITSNDTGSSPRLEDPILEANQLRFTNRQLYYETRGLGLHCNDVVIESFSDAANFLNSCSASYLKRPRVFQIMQSVHLKAENNLETEYAKSILKISKFCDDHPSITIRSCFALLKQDSEVFVTTAVGWQIRYRKHEDRLLVKAFMPDPRNQSLLKNSIDSKPTKLNVPKNFRVWPEDGPFDETIFRKTCLDSYLSSSLILPLVQGGLDRWVAVAKDIYENGI